MVTFNMVKTGKLIRELRDDLDMTQVQLAEKIGSAQSTVAQYENGTSKMSIDVLTSIAQALKTTSDYLLGLTDYPG